MTTIPTTLYITMVIFAIIGAMSVFSGILVFILCIKASFSGDYIEEAQATYKENVSNIDDK